MSGRKHEVGAANPRISRLVLGTAHFTHPARKGAFELLDAFVEAGGDTIDSARIYGDSEIVIGAWLAMNDCRDNVTVLTKGGHGVGVLPHDFAEELATELAQSNERLGCSPVDLYLLHRDNPAIPVGEIVDWLHAAVARGSARAVGVSNWRYPRIRAANAYARKHGCAPLSVVSNHYSLARPSGPFYPGLVAATSRDLIWHRDTGVPLLAWSATARGFFTGVIDRDDDAAAEADPWRRRMIEVYGTAANFTRLRRAAALACDLGVSASEIALAWLLCQPGPVHPVIGPRTVTELRSCFRALRINLSAEVCLRLAGARAQPGRLA